MTLRYASLASPTVRAAYDQAMSKARSRLTLPIAPLGQAIGATPEVRISSQNSFSFKSGRGCVLRDVCEKIPA